MERVRALARAAGWPWALATALLVAGAALGGVQMPSVAAVLVIAFSLLALAFMVGLMIGVRHSRAMMRWPIVAVPTLILVGGWPVVLGVVQPPNAAFVVAAALLFVGTSGALLIALVMLAWQRDIGVALFGWGSLALVWGLVLAAAAQTDLVTALVRALTSGDFSSLWWLGPILHAAFCLFPLGLLSLMVHSRRIVARELRGEDPLDNGW